MAGTGSASGGTTAVAEARRLPPGPRWPSLLQSVALLRFRHRFVPAMHRRYGDVLTLRLAPGGQALVLVTGPEHAREVFAGDPEVFHAGEANDLLRPVMGDHSVLLLDGSDHTRARRLLMPAFTATALRRYRPMVARLAAEEAGRWPAGVPFRALDRMNALTLEVILHVVFGVTDQARLAGLRPLVHRAIDVSPLVVLGFAHPVLHRWGPWRAAIENLRRLDTVLYDEIADRRTAPDLAHRTDVLSSLLRAGAGRDGQGDGQGDRLGDGLSDAELRDQLVTLLLAGHETTATALAWALHELARDPEQLDLAQRAADAGDTEHLEAVLKESMRLHPVIPMVVRRLTRPATVGGTTLPAGVDVAPSILLTHARGDLHPEPGAFRPDRFAGSGVPAMTWIPFGGGVRRCIGAGFSLMEGAEVLREVLSRHDLATPSGEAEAPRVRNITSVPLHGALLVARPRARTGAELTG